MKKMKKMIIYITRSGEIYYQTSNTFTLPCWSKDIKNAKDFSLAENNQGVNIYELLFLLGGTTISYILE
jgi:hypothetical protein